MSVQEVRSWVYTGGVSRGVSSVSVDREIAATTPASVGTPGGLMAATATATVHETGPVVTVKRSPWARSNSWPPAEGDPMRVLANVEGTNIGHTRFEGAIEDVDGSARDLQIGVAAVDRIDRLRRAFTVDPTASPMPLQRGSTSVRIVDPIMRHEWFVDRALRACGWNFSYLPAPGANLFVPLQGGLLDADSSPTRLYETPENPGSWHAAERGLGWSPGGGWVQWAAGDNGANSHDLVFTIQHREGGPTTQGIRFMLSGPNENFTNRADVQVTTTSSTVRVRASNNSYAHTNPTIDYTATDVPGATRITVRRDGDTETLFVNGVNVATATNPNMPTQKHPRISVAGAINGLLSDDSPIISHLLIGEPGRTLMGASTPPNALMHTGTLLQETLGATRYINTTAKELLQEIAEATCAAAWIDKDGRFHWAHPDAFDDAPPTATIDSDADMLDLSWSNSISDVFRRVQVACMDPTVTTSTRADIEWWTGSGDTIPATPEMKQAGQHYIREIASAPSNTDWFAAKIGPYIMERTTTSKNQFALMEGDWYGITVYHGSYGDPLDAYEGFTTGQTRKITSQAYEMITNAMMDPASGAAFISPRIPDSHFLESEDFAHMVPYNNSPLPVLRGFGKIEWATDTTSPAGSGPEEASDYVHDAKWWVQGGDCGRLRDWIAGQTSRSRALLDRLPVVPRFDIDLGQVITVAENQIYGVSIRALVVGIHETYERGKADMALTLRVLSTENIPVEVSIP